MSEGILFGIGFVVFIAVTTSMLIFGYTRFAALYKSDVSAAKTLRSEGNLEFYAASEPTSG